MTGPGADQLLIHRHVDGRLRRVPHVGRQNAVDKLIGRLRLYDRLPATGLVLVGLATEERFNLYSPADPKSTDPRSTEP